MPEVQQFQVYNTHQSLATYVPIARIAVKIASDVLNCIKANDDCYNLGGQKIRRCTFLASVL